MVLEIDHSLCDRHILCELFPHNCRDVFSIISSKVKLERIHMNEENLRAWVENDDKIARLKVMLAKLQKQQQSLESAIFQGVSETELPKMKVKISTGGVIRFRQLQTQPSLTQTFLLNSLKKHYQSNEAEAETVFRFILNQRVPQKRWIMKKYVQ